MKRYQVYKDTNGGRHQWFVEDPDGDCWSFSTHAEAIGLATKWAQNDYKLWCNTRTRV
jgi:hypothetical protein